MYAAFGAFSAYGEPYTQKKARFICGPKCTSMDGSKNKIDHEISKYLHENERDEHENLPGSNRERFRWTMLPEFASGVLSSNTLCWVKISNDMKNFKFFTIYRIFLKFLPTFYSFLPFLTVLDRLY